MNSVERLKLNRMAGTMLLTIVTKDQSTLIQAEHTAESIRSVLGSDWKIVSIEPYHKFEYSFMLSFECPVQDEDLDTINNRGLILTDRIVSPWLAYYDSDTNTLELIFNNDANTKGRTIDHAVLRWGQWQTAALNDTSSSE
jgi:hypothetical protein